MLLSLRRCIAVGVLLAWLPGCQHLSPATASPALPLLAPAAAGLEMQVNQQLELNADGEIHRLLTALLLTRDRVLISAVSATGQRLLTIRYDGATLESELSPALTSELPSALILGLVQLTYWPIEALREAYLPPLSLRTSALQRRIYLEQRPLITVTYNPPGSPAKAPNASGAATQRQPIAGEKIVIEHHGNGLRLVIRTLQVPSRERH